MSCEGITRRNEPTSPVACTDVSSFLAARGFCSLNPQDDKELVFGEGAQSAHTSDQGQCWEHQCLQEGLSSLLYAPKLCPGDLPRFFTGHYKFPAQTSSRSGQGTVHSPESSAKIPLDSFTNKRFPWKALHLLRYCQQGPRVWLHLQLSPSLPSWSHQGLRQEEGQDQAMNCQNYNSHHSST